jgi:hypothetical protein
MKHIKEVDDKRIEDLTEKIIELVAKWIGYIKYLTSFTHALAENKRLSAR